MSARSLETSEPPSSPRPDEPPAFGTFELTGLLGEGGSATVYAVERAGQSLALKVLRADLALSARERRRFLDEAERMRRLEHRSIVPLVDAGTLADGRPFIAMPLLAGETLAARVDRGPLDAAAALRHFDDLADAVATIHRAGLIHRDIKPENVILTAGGGVERCVLLDLGIARDVSASVSTTTEQGKVRGTRAYMAPERFFGVQASSSTDVYELAVVLYLMLVGAPPWMEGQGAASRLHPRDPVELGITMSEALRTTLLRALSTRPEVRPPSVEAFARDVRAATDARETSESPIAAATVPSAANESDVASRGRPGALRRGIAVGASTFGLAAILAFAWTSREKPSTPASRVEPSIGMAARPSSSASPAEGPPATAAAAPVASASAPAVAAPVRATRGATRKVAGAKSSEPAVESAAIVPPPAPSPVPSASSSPERLYIDRK